MNILAFDTTMRACSAAVLRDAQGEAILTHRFEERERGHAEALMPMIGGALEEAGLAYEDIDRIAVTTGPGTFTGVRVGVAAARGLALATGAGLVGATSLAVMAHGIFETHGPDIAHAAIAADARRGQVYFALYERDGACTIEPAALAPDEAANLLPDPKTLVLAGSGAALIAEAAGDRLAAQAIETVQPDAAVLCRMAANLAPADKPVSPLYLRPPDARPQDGAAMPRR